MKKSMERLLAIVLTLLLTAMPLTVMAAENSASGADEPPAVSAAEPASDDAAAYTGYSTWEDEPVYERGDPVVVVVVLVVATLLVAGVAVIRSRRTL